MLRNFGFISYVLVTSQLLAIIQQCTGRISLTCNNDKTLLVDRLEEGAPFQCLALPSSKVRNDYIHFPPLGYYKFHTEPKTWNQARNTCIGEGAHLAILNSQIEAEELTMMFDRTLKTNPSLFTGVDQNQTWLGVHDLFEEGEWVTVLGDSLNSTWTSDLIKSGWNKNSCGVWGEQPDDRNGQQNCAALIRECFTMDDVRCDHELTFICEKPAPCPQDLSD